ncbi:ARM repeat superfamily protein [Striga hermonthica]|uniref:ARM repeat superfamily protein n=1 Tax=Striga hermonthica TaxID=68872 RepID=A0A9N7N816_STRHE|nr:ARM repeat superfamily protein [Striga hermonthica]
MSATNPSKQAQTQARELKHRVLACLHKLADRDTHSVAASELESISRTLPADALPSFLSSISATDSSDKSPVRRQCVRLVAVLADHHGNSLSPHLSRILSAVVRRLRDPDSSVRSACVAASLSLSSNLTSAPFAAVTKPFLEALFTEQDSGAQNGAALCLAAVIEGSGNPDVGSLRKLLPRLEKLAKCEGFKAKAAILALIGNVVGVKGVLTGSSKNVIKNLVMCLMEFLSSEDWAARKSSAEALMKIAAVEKDALWEHKASCLKSFEAKKFDKVKAVRETMNQLLEAWKDIPDLPDEVSPLPESQPSSKENASDGSKNPQGAKSSSFNDPTKRPAQFTSGSPALTARRKRSAGINENRKSPPMFRKLDHKKQSNLKAEIFAPAGSSRPVVTEYNTPLDVDQRVSEIEEEIKPFVKPGIRRALFNEKHDLPKLGEASVVVGNEAGNDFEDPRDYEDLSLIRKQLLQIENQQSNLLEILQGFIGSSQNGIHSLEKRVHGIELALDEISFDLAVSNQKVPNNDTLCCKFPVTDFLSSKLWRKPEDSATVSRLSTRGTPSLAAAARSIPDQNQRIHFRGGHGLVMNPLAEIPRGSPGLPEASSSGVGKN